MEKLSEKVLRSLMVFSLTAGIFCGDAMAECPMVVEGRTWTYKSDYKYNNSDYGIVYHYMKFDGSIQVAEKEYSIFKLYLSDYLDYSKFDDDNPDPIIRSVEKTGPCYFVRQEGEKVYVLTQDNIIYWSETDLFNSYSESGYGEVCLYDFSLVKNDFMMLPFVPWAGIDNYEKCYIEPGQPENINNTQCKSYCLVDEFGLPMCPGQYSIEEIGITKNGHLAAFCLHLIPSTELYNNTEPGYGSILCNVREEDGSIIYGMTNGVDEIRTESPNNNHKTYDIMGRYVNATVPGSVYIRNGKKFIGK